MALTKYIEKRNFDESPEPKGGNPDSDKLRFVIQKHAASHLHYDFRLEMEGVLKSWAVPKGPSTDPDVKRLAMMVEDHPYDYRNFEGIIPSGYGAGTVIVWDEGFYEIADANGTDKETQDKELRKGIHAGKLHIVLDGKKLKGEFALVKTHGRGENAWLLFKVKDKYVSKEDIILKDKSVISKKTLEQVEKTTTNFYRSKRVKESSVKSKKETSLNDRSDVKAASERNKKEKEQKTIPDIIVTAGKRSTFPSKLSPMLATIVDKPFDKEGWQYEIKWDGYRALAFCNKDKVELKSRNDKSFDEKFYSVHKSLQQWNINAVVDGEVVVLDEESKPNFGALQNWRSEFDGVLYFYVFDLLWINGKDLMQLPLSERRIILKQIIPQNDTIRFSENFEVSGIEFFETVKKMGLEGIIAKKSDSVYSAGSRSKDWLKIKANKRQEMVIGGYTKNDDSSKSFSSLLLGFYENGELIYTGKVGTGFNDKLQIEMLKQFKPYIIKTPPFKELPDINKSSRFQRNPPHATAIWMKPELVCEVSFTEMTTDGIMRHPSFEAMRIDKKAKDVIREQVINTNEIIVPKEESAAKIVKPAGTKDLKTFLNPTDETQLREINGHEIKFSNLNKIYWPEEKITKRDMLNYYHQVAPYILPYLQDRPQSMNRHPDGINGESFYFKDVTGTAPDWIEIFEYKSDADDRVRNYLVVKDEASLLYMANLGCIEMNPWHSKVETEDYPDWCIIDLDPAENTFEQVIEAANVTKDILESMGVASYPKTSGSKGIHIYIPFEAKYTYDQSKEFARIIATLVEREIPDYTSIERAVKVRKRKMYIDFLQNRAQATVAAPYSLRPKPGATVSMPLHWEEVKKGLKMSDFTIYNALERIKSAGDIFKPVLSKGINLEKVIKTYNKE
ncbi:DNA ligase D [Flavobacterium sp. LB3P122]|uniref:DNA ligase D n=1 Tax=Flavobacterium algoriphilum TaxID=3398738 RepID=UPI003A8C423C